MSETTTPKCRMCSKPLGWAPLGTLSDYVRRTIATPPDPQDARATERYNWAMEDKARVEKYRAENKRGHLGTGDFCGQLCASQWAHSIMHAIRQGTHMVVKL